MRVLPARRNRPGGFLAGRPVQVGARRSASDCVSRSRAVRVGTVDLRSRPLVLRARQHQPTRRRARQAQPLQSPAIQSGWAASWVGVGDPRTVSGAVGSSHPGRPHRPFGERDQPRLPGSPRRAAGEGARGVPVCEALAEALGLRGLGQAPRKPLDRQGGRPQGRTADPHAAKRRVACLHDRRVRGRSTPASATRLPTK